MVTCPNCKSVRVGHFRLDSDWGDGGDWSAANPCGMAEYSTPELQSFANNERPDIECSVCCECGTCF